MLAGWKVRRSLDIHGLVHFQNAVRFEICWSCSYLRPWDNSYACTPTTYGLRFFCYGHKEILWLFVSQDVTSSPPLKSVALYGQWRLTDASHKFSKLERHRCYTTSNICAVAWDRNKLQGHFMNGMNTNHMNHLRKGRAGPEPKHCTSRALSTLRTHLRLTNGTHTHNLDVMQPAANALSSCRCYPGAHHMPAT